MKELFIALHEQKIEKYLEENPDASEADAYDLCVPTDKEYQDYVGDMVDRAWQAEKDRRLLEGHC